MGYMITSLAALSDDGHGLFLIFFPTNQLKYEWINTWIYERFGLIAQRLGPEAVLVAPVYREGYRDNLRPECPFWFGRDADILLHTGFPFLAVTRDPNMVSSPKSDAVLINLAAFQNELSLSGLFDELIATKSTELPARLANLPISIPSTDLRHDDEYPPRGAWILSEALELKPNFFGLGVNINNMADRWFRGRSARRRRKWAVGKKTS